MSSRPLQVSRMLRRGNRFWIIYRPADNVTAARRSRTASACDPAGAWPASMTAPAKRRWLMAGVLAANAVGWLIPSDVVEMVAREQVVVLGRYSRSHFLWLLFVAAASAVGLFVGLAANARAARLRAFRLATVLAGAFVASCAADVALRFITPVTYKIDRLAFRRPEYCHFHITYEDVPPSARSYPVARPGYGTVECELTMDANGFRNATDLTEADVVVLGDSFAEGSRVTDDEAWPFRVARGTGRTVANLGMSGYSPQHCRAALRDFGLTLRPKWVLLLLYEGNDFRETRIREGPSIRLKNILRTSPILGGIERLLVQSAASVCIGPPPAGMDLLSWMPVAAGPPDATRYYAFAPKQLIDLYVAPADFAGSPQWRIAAQILAALRDDCRAAGARLAVIYAPVKAHVVFPLAADGLPAEKVRGFVALRARRPLPPPDEFVRMLLERLDAKESVVRDWCAAESLPFLTLTPALRAAAAEGRQTYYTYDQHWSPVGHAVAAEAIIEFWLSSVEPTGRAARRTKTE